MKDIELDELLIYFKKYLPIWQKAFKIRGGKVVLHFDENGEIRKAEFITQYKPKKVIPNLALDKPFKNNL